MQNQSAIMTGERNKITYRIFKINQLLSERTHFIVEAKSKLARFSGSEDKVSLTLLGTLQNCFLVRTDDFVVYIERAAGLDLQIEMSIQCLPEEQARI